LRAAARSDGDLLATVSVLQEGQRLVRDDVDLPGPGLAVRQDRLLSWRMCQQVLKNCQSDRAAALGLSHRGIPPVIVAGEFREFVTGDREIRDGIEGQPMAQIPH
jgi:hypothetical protein